jgi:hypothetical protein
MAKTKKEKEAVDTIKDTCKLLRTMGVTSVTCTYDGSGDSGDMQDIMLVSGALVGENSSKSLQNFVDRHVSTVETSKQLFTQKMADALENALWKIVSDNFPGWENEDGAFGEIDVTVEDGKIKVEHNQRYTEVNTYEKEF